MKINVISSVVSGRSRFIVHRSSVTVSRTGFTLIEMMVAMTLTIFVMIILSQVFVQSLETFSGVKAIGDMQANLRTTANIMRDDLRQDHFDGKRRLSDPSFSAFRIREGFFYLQQGTPSVSEGADQDGLGSHRA